MTIVYNSDGDRARCKGREVHNGIGIMYHNSYGVCGAISIMAVVASRVGARDCLHAKGVSSEPAFFVHETFQLYLRGITSNLPPSIFYNNPNICTKNIPAAKDFSSGPSTCSQRYGPTDGRRECNFQRWRQQNPYHISAS